jgi:hypothetical protein
MKQDTAPTHIIYQNGKSRVVTVDDYVKKNLKVTADKNYINISSEQKLFFEKMKLDTDELIEVNFDNNFVMQKDFKLDTMLCNYLSFRIKHNDKDMIIELYPKKVEKPIKHYYNLLQEESNLTIEDCNEIEQLLIKRKYDVVELLKDFNYKSFQDYLSHKKAENLNVIVKTDIARFEGSLMGVLGYFNFMDKQLEPN